MGTITRAKTGKILVVAPRLPFFDRNAGDFRVYSITRLLSENNSVVFLPLRRYPRDGKYRATLEAAGVPVLAGRAKTSRYLKKQFSNGVFSSVLFEWFHSVVPLGKLLPFMRNVIIDTHELRYIKHQRREMLCGGTKERSGPGRSPEIATYRLADSLIAVSKDERAVLRLLFPAKPVTVIDTCIEVSGRHRAGFAGRKDIVFFASFANPGQRPAHNPNRDAVRYFTKKILPLVRKVIPDIEFHVLGAGASSLRYRGIVAGGEVNNIEEELGKFRVCVCPLRYGAGVKKKLLDAAAAGTPVVTTSIGAEGLDFRDGRDLLIADTPAEFAERIVFLYRDRSQWEKIARNASAVVRKRYRMDVMRRQLGQLSLGEK